MNILFFTILAPLIGFFLLALSSGRWMPNTIAIVGVGSIALSFFSTAWVALDFFSNINYINLVFKQYLWTWISINDFNITMTLNLDGLSISMLSVITGVGFLVHWYAAWYMREKEGYSRFFAYTNLFIASMVILVLADNFLMMFLGWEGVGVCSYLLICFNYKEKQNISAAMKAFIMTRIGDVFLLYALFILYKQFGTLNFNEIMTLSKVTLDKDYLVITTLMLLIGSISKSAQIPLQTWLSDAMVGPTPASALIHSATMVTAGVYLITRTHELFFIAQNVLYLVSIIGAVTIIFSGLSALVQTDIKKILAYSTMGQIGYMFLALGIQAWSAAIFHLIIHAFFKALLFLSASSLIMYCNNEQNIFKIGGRYKSLPLEYICFLIGGASLSAFPFITSGFFSKEKILFLTLSSNHLFLTFIGLIGSFLTTLYTFRMIFIVFHGNNKKSIKSIHRGSSNYIPLVILLIASSFIGNFISIPLDEIFNIKNISNNYELNIKIISILLTIIGLFLSKILWLRNFSTFFSKISTQKVVMLISNFLFHGFGFDWLYNKIFVQFYILITRILVLDPIIFIINIPILFIRMLERNLILSVNGYLRWYVVSMILGAIIILNLLIIISK